MEAVKNKIVGTWKLLSIYYKNEKGKEINLYGENPNGILMYDQYGYMNAQLGSSNRAKISSAALSGGTNKEKVAAFDSYMGYYGNYYEKEPGVVIHEVEACTIPNWAGGKEIRYCKIENGLLYISTPKTTIGGCETVIEVIWKRVV